MKLVRASGGGIGLHVELPEGPHVIDIAKSLGVFAAHDPVSGALINGVLKEKSVWGALVNNWHYLRRPLALLARTALINPGDQRLVLQPAADASQECEAAAGIVELDIIGAADFEIRDPMARRFAECAAEPSQSGVSPKRENVRLIDFSRANAARTRRE